MGANTYPLRAIVLRNTKLSETDLVVTLLAQDGRQVRAVAKGARKPTSSFAARLDLFAEVDLLMVEGKSLDIVKEARLVNARRNIISDMEHAAAAAVVVDFAGRVTQEDMTFDRFFDLTRSALDYIDSLSTRKAVSICAAYLLKAFAFSGLRPSLDRCASCGTPMDLASMPPSSQVYFSVGEGGVICPNCLMYARSVSVPVEVLTWADFMLKSTFADVADADVDLGLSFEILKLCQSWCSEHISSRLKSLEFLFTVPTF